MFSLTSVNFIFTYFYVRAEKFFVINIENKINKVER